MTDMATFSTDRDTVRFTGSLSLAKIGDLPERLRAFDGAVTRLDLSAIERMDTVGAWLIHRFAAEHDAEVVGLDSDEARLVMGKRSDAVLELLGTGNRSAVVHRDNMVLVGAKEDINELG